MTSKVIIDPSSTRRTSYGSKHQTAMSLGKPVPYSEKETLNELYDVLSGVTPEKGTWSHLGYFQFGINGVYMNTTTDSRQELATYPHQPTHGGLFSPMPFALRRKNNDLTAAQRTAFSLRTTLIKDEVEYWAYWLCELDTSDTVITTYIKDTVNNTEIVFVPSTETLSPTPQRPSIEDENIVSGSFASIEAEVAIKLESWQIDEMIAAKQIITGTSTLDINEIAICLGQPYQIQITDGSDTVPFMETIVAQPTAFFGNRFNLNTYKGNGLTLRFNAGIDDPLSLAVADLT